MLTKTSSRIPGRVLAVLAAITSLSGLAEAQQSGLFPLQYNRRDRTPCASEEPIYKLYRDQYYGYFPTRWRRFPDNWALTSPEGPNTKEALKKNPIEGPKAAPLDNEGDEMPGPAGPGAKPAIPNPPPDTERSPFEMDKPDNGAGAAPGGGAPARRNPAPRGNTPPGAEASPFDTPGPNPPGAGAMPGDRPQASQPNRLSTPTLPDPGTPDLTPPGNAPAAPPRTSWNRRSDYDRQKDPGPLLSMSDATLPSVEEASSPASPAGGTAVADTDANNSATTAPATSPAASQPAPRRGPISSLFAGLGWPWLRR